MHSLSAKEGKARSGNNFSGSRKAMHGSMFNVKMGASLAKFAAIDVGMQFIGWMVSSYLRTEVFFDVLGSLTHVLLALLSLRQGGRFFYRQRMNTGLVSLWAVRLGTFLLTRMLRDRHDARFDAVRDVPSKFLMFWLLQAVWIFVTQLPTLLNNIKQRDTELTGRDYVGWSMWILGFLLQAIADYQKATFRGNPDNAGRFITSGLWGFCRHPNYLGEILMWTGVYLSCSNSLRDWENIAIVSPIFVICTLRYVSGIPLLEKSGLKRWGSNPAYQKYLRETPRLFPIIYP